MEEFITNLNDLKVNNKEEYNNYIQKLKEIVYKDQEDKIIEELNIKNDNIKIIEILYKDREDNVISCITFTFYNKLTIMISDIFYDNNYPWQSFTIRTPDGKYYLDTYKWSAACHWKNTLEKSGFELTDIEKYELSNAVEIILNKFQ